MASVFDSYVGAVDEVTYSTAVPVTRFFELSKESISGKYERVESAAMQTGQRVMRADRFAPNPKGADGTLELEVLDKGFAFWLKHMLGNVAKGTADPDGFSVFTGTIADLAGKSTTVEVGRVDASGALSQFVYTGGKVSSWEISNQVDGVLNLNVDMVFAKETVRVGTPVTPTYPSASHLFTYLGGTFTLDGTTVAVSDVTIKGDNGLKDDRWAIGVGRREPREEKSRDIEFELKGDFDSMTAYNKVVAATATGNMGNLVLTWAGVPLDGQPTKFPTITVTIPNARFDEATPQAEAGKLPDITISGKALNLTGNDAITIAYKSQDTAI
ncbi:phage tail tube protein [Streptomyces cadmiisoli]|uniref:phage tail tube protein n=1 Tax=Streptomyces cadmiisoli TaxID=2184053 RepID=UPI0013A70602|nr:phage tail tube protein [Streptomyces cadmiisoli]